MESPPPLRSIKTEEKPRGRRSFTPGVGHHHATTKRGAEPGHLPMGRDRMLAQRCSARQRKRLPKTPPKSRDSERLLTGGATLARSAAVVHDA